MFRVEPRSERVAVLAMDDGKVNAIGPAFVDAEREGAGFPRAWREAAGGDRVVVLAGNAKAFSAGLDLRTLPTLERDALVAFFRGFVRMLLDVYAHPRPTVAVVDGPALAGGAFLAQCCDARLATPATRIGYTEVLVGIPFPAPVLALARAELAADEATPAILHAAVREGEAAVRYGWAHRLVPREGALDAGVAVAEELAGHSPRAYAAAKAGMRGALAREVEAFEKEGAEPYVDELLHPDTVESIVGYFARVTGKR